MRSTEERSGRWDRVPVGFGLGVLAHVVGIGLILAMPPSGRNQIFGPREGLVFLIGGTQLLYLVPVFLLVRHRGWRHVARGLVILGAVTALLNAGCWGLAMSGML